MINDKKPSAISFKKTALIGALSFFILGLSGCNEDAANDKYVEDAVETTPKSIEKTEVNTIENPVEVVEENQKTELVKPTKSVEENFNPEQNYTNQETNETATGVDRKTNNSLVPDAKKSDVSIEKNGEIITALRNIYVVDGDTLYGENKMGEQMKIRLTGIDAPERDQMLGDVSKLSLKDCVDQSPDIRVIVQAKNETDKYERALGKVMAGDVDCNLWQVGSGMAWFYRQYSSQLGAGDAAKYEAAEKAAKGMNAGIWMEDMQPAWEYRKK